ncbi:MAG: DNA polymerase III subunit epsilon [Gammaproteobacteria bacterium]|nr:DNA polymerase III subunit epsilon [Gammaproteobacteria bacterium]
MRQIVLDTETTGLDPKKGARIIEIGCVEIINRKITERYFHTYICPDQSIDPGALKVHGITEAFLRDKPKFEAIAQEFLKFIERAELIIHNASFDLNFLNYELGLINTISPKIQNLCQILDTLALARRKHPGQRNALDHLCKRYRIDAEHRTAHGALLDAKLLAEVYLKMTRGQATLDFEGDHFAPILPIAAIPLTKREPLLVLKATAEHLERHAKYLKKIESESGLCLWNV